MTTKDKQKLYIVLSQTGSWLSALLGIITGATYNHVSLSLDPSLEEMYSFGRRFAYNPVWGGFVKESKSSGSFKRFKKTKVVVMSLDIDSKTYQSINTQFEDMIQHKYSYHYNYIGLVLAGLRIKFNPKNHYYCSQFAKELMINNSIEGADKLDKIPLPEHFMELPNISVIYKGKFADYKIDKKDEAA